MSDLLGPLSVSPATVSEADEGAPPWSERILAEVDAEVQTTLRRAETDALAALEANAAVLVALAEALEVEESIDGEKLSGYLDQVRRDAPAGHRELAVTGAARISPSI